MNKENFVNVIEGLIQQDNKTEKFDKALEPFFDNYLISTLSNTFQNTIINMLENEMNDVGETVSWWLYDAPQAGKNKNSCYIEMPDGKKISIETPEQLYDYFISQENNDIIINKMYQFKNIWLMELATSMGVDAFNEHILEVVEDEGESTNIKWEHRYKCNLYTDNYRYCITVVDREDDGYLGCTVSNRKPLPGEKHTRGNDLPDGPFVYETWEHIKNVIIGYELLPLHKKVHGPAITKEA